MSINAINEINRVIGYSPSSIVYDNNFKRFKTAKALDGAYIASEWTYNNKQYNTVTYCDYHGDQVWHTHKSWLDDDFKTFSKEQFKEFKLIIEGKEKETKKQIYETYKEASQKVQEFYNKATPAQSSHLYLERKQIQEIVNYDKELKQHGHDLIIPLKDFKNQLWSYQTIALDGSKRYKSEAKKKECFHLIGNISNDTKIVFIGEGYATMASVYLATQKPCFITFDTSNLKLLVPEITEYVRSIAPNCLVIITADDDRFNDNGNAGINAASKACKNLIGVFYIKPSWVPNYKELTEKKATDYNDLHCISGINHVKQQLNENNLIEIAKSRYYIDRYRTISIYKDQSEDYPLGYSITDAVNVCSFSMSIDYQGRKENDRSALLYRFATLRSQQTEKNFIEFKAGSVFKSSTEFQCWLRDRGNGFNTMNGFNHNYFFNTLDYQLCPELSILERFGKQEDDSFLFKNILINPSKRVIQLNDKKYFPVKFDKNGRELGLKLDDSYIKNCPSLSINESLDDSKQILQKLIKQLIRTYSSVKPLIALGYSISALFMDSLENRQFPILNLYGEPQSGKSNLIKILEYIHGFDPNNNLHSGVIADSTIPQIEKSLTRSNNLITAIKEVKQDKMEMIQKIVQSAFDGELRQKSTRDKVTGDWTSEMRRTQTAIVIDSNHTFTMESVVERIIPVHFKAADFSASKAQEINKLNSKLSSIIYHILISIDDLTFQNNYNTAKSNILKINPLLNSRTIEGISIIFAGINTLLDFYELKNDFTEDMQKLQDYLFSEYLDSHSENKSSTKPDAMFFEWIIDVYLQELTVKENNLKDALKTPFKIDDEEIILSTKLVNKALHEFHRINSKLFSLQDLKKAVKDSDIPISKKTVRILDNTYHSLILLKN